MRKSSKNVIEDINSLAEEVAKELYDNSESYEWIHQAEKISPVFAIFLNRLIMQGDLRDAEAIAEVTNFYSFVRMMEPNTFERFMLAMKVVYEYGAIRGNENKMRELRDQTKQFSKVERFKPQQVVHEYLAKKYNVTTRQVKAWLQKYRKQKLAIYQPDEKVIKKIKKIFSSKSPSKK